MVSQTMGPRRLDENVAVWHMEGFPMSLWNACMSKGHLESKVTSSLFTELLPPSPYRMELLLEGFFIVNVLPSSERKKKPPAKITYLFSQEGKINFKTLRMRAAPTTPTTMTSIKLKKIGKDLNQNLHNPFLKSSTHWHITYNQKGKNKRLCCKT